MSLNNYTNIGTTAAQFAALKNQIRNGKTFSGMTSTTWISGNATFNLTNSIADWEDSVTRFRVKPDDPDTPWSDWHAATGDVFVINDNTVVTVDEDIIPNVYSNYVLMIEVQAANGYARLATANTWNELNTAIKLPLSTADLSHATITANDTYTIRLGDLTGYTASDYIGIDEDTELIFTVNVPQSGQASGPSTSVSGLSVNSASLSGGNYTIGLTSGEATTSFTTYGIVSGPVTVSSIATNITVPKVVISTTPSIDSQNNTATFRASTAGYLNTNDGGLVLNCYTGALEE